jgi:hypothetical protein
MATPIYLRELYIEKVTNLALVSRRSALSYRSILMVLIELVKIIYAQSVNLKHRFKLLRNGKEDTNTGLQRALNEEDFTSI